MEHKFEGILMVFLTMAIGVILVASVVLPQTFAPSARSLVGVNNTTAFVPINSTGGYINLSITTTYLYATSGCNLTVTFNHNYTPNYTILTTVAGVSIGNLTAASNNASNISVIAIPAANLNTTTNGAGQVVQKFNYTTLSDLTTVNVTGSYLACIQKSSFEQRGADAGSIAMWAIVPLVIISSLILLVMGGRR